MNEPGRTRQIRSFIRREGRITPGQRQALERLLPHYGVSATAGPIDLEKLFGRRAPCVMEIGFGNGTGLIELARQHPEKNFFGIEVHRPGVGRLLMSAERENLENIRVSTADAIDVLRDQIPDDSISAVLLFFPDPWPKKRHHKRRLVTAGFAALVANKLIPGGRFLLATDWEGYAMQMLSVLNACPMFKNLDTENAFIPRPAERPETHFEQRGRRLGHKVWDLAFEKQGA